MGSDRPDFEQHRPHLLRVGYRITGSIADAEDAVQDAWLRFATRTDAEVTELREPRAWLTTVVARICLDRLRSAASRRERYVGPWLPEPLLTTGDPDDPLAAVVRDDGVRMAAMVVLEQLSPPQRVALVLHEALDVPFGQIAEVLGCTVTAARQHASRARRIVAAADPPPRARDEQQRELLDRFAAAVSRGDGPALLAVLHPDVAWVADTDGRTRAARQVVRGVDKVSRLALGLLKRYGDALTSGWDPVGVNGELGFRTPPISDTDAGVTVCAVRDGRIVAIYQMFNPEKLEPGTPHRSPGR
ncbi:RNA polymerase sigma factor SigJ [Pseudonocardia sp. GCM10023141]|uniref:RNA polymerase sigma factor SigJ n=1 Tax=Pseudonocardia sp. GCM10023141 TaxID=3252653 RepID=UPI00360F3A1B